jgi:hypothetical protein
VTAVSLVKGSCRTGCDIQLVQKRANIAGIANEYFSAYEIEYILGDMVKFYQIWVLKECYIKLKGLSVFDMAKVPSFICRDKNDNLNFAFEAEVKSPLLFYLYELNDQAGKHYMLAVCIEGVFQVQDEIKWFSEPCLPLRRITKINAAPSPAQTVSPKM